MYKDYHHSPSQAGNNILKMCETMRKNLIEAHRLKKSTMQLEKYILEVCRIKSLSYAELRKEIAA